MGNSPNYKAAAKAALTTAATGGFTVSAIIAFDAISHSLLRSRIQSDDMLMRALQMFNDPAFMVVKKCIETCKAANVEVTPEMLDQFWQRNLVKVGHPGLVKVVEPQQTAASDGTMTNNPILVTPVRVESLGTEYLKAGTAMLEFGSSLIKAVFNK